MKVYINNLNLDLLSHFMTSLTDYLIRTEMYTLIYSINGIYKASERIKKLEVVDDSFETFFYFYENFSLIVDKSYFNEVDAYNVDPEHISTKVKRHIYKISNEIDIELIIEGSDNDKFIPNDLYFELPSNLNINDKLVKKELIVFLSLLK